MNLIWFGLSVVNPAFNPLLHQRYWLPNESLVNAMYWKEWKGVKMQGKTRKRYAFHYAGTGITLVQFLVVKEHLVQKTLQRRHSRVIHIWLKFIKRSKLQVSLVNLELLWANCQKRTSSAKYEYLGIFLSNLKCHLSLDKDCARLSFTQYVP